ncbi:hypothetical protein GBAR_LOCUS17475 [Geodia barretti]|uniref:Secreted protein n=1 Tax=Geodia barretti TaxID=519541 RepID=A0AA35SKM2_GEOBA|nr:hypothetical protein GBAR_LOCUS17475 [Geodia barretti]
MILAVAVILFSGASFGVLVAAQRDVEFPKEIVDTAPCLPSHGNASITRLNSSENYYQGGRGRRSRQAVEALVDGM